MGLPPVVDDTSSSMVMNVKCPRGVRESEGSSSSLSDTWRTTVGSVQRVGLVGRKSRDEYRRRSCDIQKEVFLQPYYL